jgi:hypothetical protein
VVDEDAGLLVVDVSDPTAMDALIVHDTPGTAEEVVVAGSYAYVAAAQAGLRVVEISFLIRPWAVEVGAYETVGSAGGIFVADDPLVSSGRRYAYVPAGDAGLRIVDVSDPAAPMCVGAYDTPSYAQAVHVVSNHAFVADRLAGLRVVDASNPAAPVEVGAYNTPGFVWDVHVVGPYAYVIDQHYGLRIVDVSDPTNPAQVGFYDAWDVRDVYVADDPSPGLGRRYAYVAYGRFGFRVIDVSDPTAPVQVGAYSVFAPPPRLYVTGGYAYAAFGSSLHVVDVSDPTAPVKVGSIAGPADGVYVTGGYAYVAAGRSGLRVIDVSDPADPVEVAHYDTPGFAGDIFVVPPYAYLADGEGGLAILRFVRARLLLPVIVGDSMLSATR